MPFLHNSLYRNRPTAKDSNSIVSEFDDHIRMPVPKRPFVFYKEIQNFTVVPKRPFVFLKQNTKF